MSIDRDEKPHKRLEAWRLAIDLVIHVYRATAGFPAQERFALADQMRRAAVSIASNIAEGAARQTRREFAQFLHVARGSLSELDTQVEIALRLGYIRPVASAELQLSLESVDRLMNGLVRSLTKTRG